MVNVWNTLMAIKITIILDLYAFMHCFTSEDRIHKTFSEWWKKMSFKIEQNSVLLKYNDIWNKTKKILNMKFYSTPIYDQKYIRIKVKTWGS